MTSTLHPHPAYKPSGVPWLEDVPEHWEVRRLKAVCLLAYGDSLPAVARGYGIVPVYGSNGPVGMHTEANTEAPCIVVGRKGSFGKVHYSTRPVFAIDTTYYVDERHSTANLAWLSRVLDWLQLDAVTRDSAIPGLNREDAYDRLLPFPPLPEQTAIVWYLDYVDRRIRRYVSAKRKLVALLEEEKQAIVNRAVTRGLDPNVRLKPSGVEWLGDVPAHWEVRRFRTLGKGFRNGITAEQLEFGESACLVSRIETISNGTVDYTRVGYIAEGSNYQAYLLKEDDFLISHINSYAMVGNSARYKGDRPLIHGMNLIRVTTLKSVVPVYLEYMLKSSVFLGAMQRACKPAINQVSVTTTAIKAIHFPLPPTHEQAAIVGHLDKVTTYIDGAIARTRRQIELVEEYRTRFIADVVTGKLDVREAASQLPDEDSEAEPIGENGPLADGQPGDLYSIDESVEDLVMEEEVTA